MSQTINSKMYDEFPHSRFFCPEIFCPEFHVSSFIFQMVAMGSIHGSTSSHLATLEPNTSQGNADDDSAFLDQYVSRVGTVPDAQLDFDIGFFIDVVEV